MMLLPIVERELRVTARQWRTYWGRSTVGTVALCAVLYLIWLAGQVQGPSAGPMLLKIVSYIALGICIFAGANRSADCLSSEKRGDTLGLLFLTHLRAHDIVLGKLAANSIHALLFLVSVLPILSIPVMLGGVTGQDLVCLPVSLFNALLFSQSIGILCSAIFKAQRKAILASSLSLILLVVLMPSLGLVVKTEWDMPLAATVMSLTSPIFAHEMSFNGAFGLSRLLFWTATGLQFAFSIACLVAACLILPRAWQVRNDDLTRAKALLRQWALGTPEARKERRARLLARNPIFWAGARERFAPLAPVLFMTVGFSVVGWSILHYQLPGEPAFASIFVCLAIVDFQFRARVANLSSIIFARERQMGTWEMILSAPLTVPEILRGNQMAVRHAALKSYLVFLSVLIATQYLAIARFGSSAHVPIAMMFVIISIGEFFALGPVAMWRGMRAHSPQHASGQALLRVTVLPWIAWLLLLPLIQEIDTLRHYFDQHTVATFVTTTGVLWTLSTATAVRTARRNLLRHFRDPESAPSLWRALRRRCLAIVNLSRTGPSAQELIIAPIRES